MSTPPAASSSTPQPTLQEFYDMQQQIVRLSAQLAAIQQPTMPPASTLPSNVRIPTPAAFKGQADGDTVTNFIESVENWFELTGISDDTKKARLASIFLEEKARTWFSAQGYTTALLKWTHLKSDLLRAFRPADYDRYARTLFSKVKQTGQNVSGYIDAFNAAYRRCKDVSDAEARFQFEEGLWAEVRLQVLNAQPNNLAEAQAVAQRAGMVLQHSQMFGYGKKNAGFQVGGGGNGGGRQNGGGDVEMRILGNMQGRGGSGRGRETRQCFNCGKTGHVKKDCYAPGGGAHRGGNGGGGRGRGSGGQRGGRSGQQRNGQTRGQFNNVEGQSQSGKLSGAAQAYPSTGVTEQVPPLPISENTFAGLEIEDVAENSHDVENVGVLVDDFDVFLPLPPAAAKPVKSIPQAQPKQTARGKPIVTDNAPHPRTRKCVHPVRGQISKIDSPECPRLLQLSMVHESGHVVKALLDSGATNSFIHADVASQLCATMTQSDTMIVTLADGTESSSSQVANVALAFTSQDGSVHSTPQQLSLRVLPQLQHQIILGMDWLRTNNPIINWIDYTVQITSTSGDVFVAAANAVESTIRVELCSMQQVLKSVKKYDATAWFALLRESRAAVNGLHGAPVGNPDRFSELCTKYQDVFAEPGMPPQRDFEHRIDLLDEAAPVPRPRQYRLSSAEQAEVQKQVEQLLSKGWIRPSVSPYGAPILFVRKKTGELHMCIDFRLLNKNTVVDVFPIPRIADLLDKLSKARVFSSIDLASAYHQVRVHEAHCHRTAFLTPTGLYEYVVLPFGLCNAPATFQRLMSQSFGDMFGKFMVVYLDDILVFSNTIEEHYAHLEAVFKRLREQKYYAKLQKCSFGRDTVKYLGHVVSNGTITVDDSKTEAIRSWPTPTSVKDIQQFLGLANYYNNYIKGFATLASPLTELLGKKVAWVWGERQQSAFDCLKDRLCSSPVLRLPDLSRDFVLQTDASDVATGAVLLQQHSDGLHPVSYFSRKLNPAERNYSTYDKELLAIFRACMKWRCYIDTQQTVVYTDHQPLTYISQSSHPSRRAATWIDKLSELHLQIVHTPGPLNVVADVLSRPPEREISRLTDDDLSRVSGWLRRIAPQCSAQQCAAAAFEALSAGRQLAFIKCQKCSAAHLDEQQWAVDLHTKHQCSSCGAHWNHTPQVQGNPLAAWKPRVHGHALVLGEVPDAKLGTVELGTVAVEPAWLGNVYQSQQDSSDPVAVGILARARGADGQYCTRVVHGFELVYRNGPGGVLQLYIPASNGLRQLLMEELHCSQYSAHLGVRKTLSALKQRVFWPGIDREVQKFVKGCAICQRIKDSTTLPQGLLQPLPIPSGKFEQWSLNFVTDLPEVRGFNGFMTCVDKFSKFTRIIPVKFGQGELSAEFVAQLFFDNVVRLFGLPKSVLHDRDPRFTSTFWQSLWKILGSKAIFSSAYHPQTDGQTERQQRTVEQLIRAQVLENPDITWLDALSHTELAVNNMVNDSTGEAPAMICYGQLLSLPVDTLDGVHPNDRAQQTVSTWEQLTRDVTARLLHAQRMQKQYADRKRQDVDLPVGTRVYLSARNIRLRGSRKLLPRFVGPFRVLEKIGKVAYRLDLSDSALSNLHNVFHISLLKQAFDNGLSKPPPPLTLEEGDEQEFEIRCILNHRKLRGKMQYLVSFTGYDESEDMWLDEENLANAKVTLLRYKLENGL